MSKITFAMLALAAGVMGQGLAPVAAEAAVPVAKIHNGTQSAITHVNHRMHYGVRHFDGGRRFHHRHHFFGPRLYFGPTYGYRYHNSCYWLKERAEDTGSRYWWRRYWRCRNGW